MSGQMSFSSFHGGRSLQLIKDSMLQSDELPLAEVLDNNQWHEVFANHGIDFGSTDDVVYTPAITLWALISQAFFKGEMRSCKAAVARVTTLWATLGRTVCSTNTGAYCRARTKITWEAVRDICTQIAESAEAMFDCEANDDDHHEVVAEVLETSTVGRVLLVDGFTITATDTPENQEEFPQNPSQKEGLGFPIVRGVSLISMVTGLLFALELGPYAGKQSGETALLWRMLDQLKSGDTLVADSYYCTYWLVAACVNKGVRIVMKNHHKRDDDPSGAARLNKYERKTVWSKPDRPKWMNEDEYKSLPEEVEIRLVDVTMDQPGFRSKQFTVATTIMDHKLYSRQWIACVYRSRWLVELDIRAIKCSLGMDVVRARTPGMVKTEIWSCLLAYNLIRLKMLQAAALAGRMPRTLSFTATMQTLATVWIVGVIIHSTELIDLTNQAAVSERVAKRPGRVEPRANKRRPKLIALMTKPRHQAKRDLIEAAAA